MPVGGPRDFLPGADHINSSCHLPFRLRNLMRCVGVTLTAGKGPRAHEVGRNNPQNHPATERTNGNVVLRNRSRRTGIGTRSCWYASPGSAVSTHNPTRRFRIFQKLWVGAGRQKREVSAARHGNGPLWGRPTLFFHGSLLPSSNSFCRPSLYEAAARRLRRSGQYVSMWDSVAKGSDGGQRRGIGYSPLL